MVEGAAATDEADADAMGEELQSMRMESDPVTAEPPGGAAATEEVAHITSDMEESNAIPRQPAKTDSPSKKRGNVWQLDQQHNTRVDW